MILQVALDTPLRRVFDYRYPKDLCDPTLHAAARPGVRVRVPFGRRVLVGIVVATIPESQVPADKLKHAVEFLDTEPVFDAVTFDLLRWAADYYHHPIGAVFAAALPVSLREGQSARLRPRRWDLTPSGEQERRAPSDRRAPKQRALLEWLATNDARGEEAIAAEFKPDLLRTVAARGWIVAVETEAALPAASWPNAPGAAPAASPDAAMPDLTPSQSEAVAAILASLSRFAPHLLHGVTGSGKTEVYLQVIARVIASGGQALVLVPEIALTPQLVARFERRFGTGIAVLHSGLAGSERRDAWRRAHAGEARIVIGTRSAVFASLPRLSLIVVDEEHDASYKQQEGFRYSGRDLAVLRAQRAAIPIILGSATPSLETLENVAQGRYSRLSLPQRAGIARAPQMRLIDLKKHASEQGLSQPALQAIRDHLDAGGQIIVFLNRRGYAPTLFCNQCGWAAPCAYCDARMTLHRRAARLRCHHCGAQSAVPTICGQCSHPLFAVGQGTERVEETLERLFPDAPLVRLDRDTASARGGMQAVLSQVQSGAARILVGTQMLTKGHHFPEVSLVVILDADQGLFASDYRATERLAQMIIQVAGRAGRDARVGEVLIQTEFPEHPLLNRLISAGYEEFATGALAERRDAHWPPFSRLALLRAEARQTDRLDAFLNAAAALGARAGAGDTGRGGGITGRGGGGGGGGGGIRILGPASALLARRADYFRAHLLIEADERQVLQRFLSRWLTAVEGLPAPSGLRWSIDVDPLEVD